MTHDEWIPIYENLARNGYGFTSPSVNRAKRHYDVIKRISTHTDTVFDASCGAGHLVRLLSADGYLCKGSEATQFFIDSLKSNYDVSLMRYSDLKTIPSNAFDIVVSSDVLEHMLTEEEAKEAIAELARIAIKYLVISIGLTKQRLHHVAKEAQWWKAIISRHVTILEEESGQKTYYCLGAKQ